MLTSNPMQVEGMWPAIGICTPPERPPFAARMSGWGNAAYA